MTDTQPSDRSRWRKFSRRSETYLRRNPGDLPKVIDDAVRRTNEHLLKAGVDPLQHLSAHQFDAMVSYVASVGDETLRAAHTNVSVIDACRPDEQHRVPDLLRKWVKVDGKVDEDTRERREREITLWQWTNDRMQLLSPKLRMIANGDDEVNGYRSLLACSVSSTSNDAAVENLTALEVKSLESADPDKPLAEPEAPAPSAPAATADEESDVLTGVELARSATVSCFVHRVEGARRHGSDATGISDGSIEVHEIPVEVLDRVRLGDLRDSSLAEVGEIAYIEPGSALAPPRPHLGGLSGRLERAPLAPVLPSGVQEDAGVVVGIIDVGGFDFAHEDFLLAGQGVQKTRFIAIWDQGLIQPGDATVPDERSFLWEGKQSLDTGDQSSTSVQFGAVYSGDDLNEALVDASVSGAGFGPHDLVPQSAQLPGSHGTHVASIAAGNRGVCPHAEIVGVTIAMGDDDQGRRQSFYDSTRLGQAIDFILDVADQRGKPVAINISLGTNGHAHDGTSPINKWIETSLRRQGRVVCVAAGNSGQETATHNGDIGYMSGRIHSSGRIAAKDLVVELDWQVVGNGVIDVSENEMEIWYNPGDEFAVQIRTPDDEVSEWVTPGAFLENWSTNEDTFVSVYSERFLHANGANRISVFLSPRYKEPLGGIQPGVWTVRLRGERVRDGRFDAWIERDDPRPVGDMGETHAWSCPSFFTIDSNQDRCSVNSLACGASVIAVGNADARGATIHPSSSQGPTRDGRRKPDIAATGTDVIAARGFANGGDQWMRMTGTSMAAPWATGVAACMLRSHAALTARQILGLMKSTARPLPGSDYAWRGDAGYGVLDAAACLSEMERVFEQSEQRPHDTPSPQSSASPPSGSLDGDETS